MKLSITRGGGLAGIATQTELSSDALPAEAAQTLHEHAKAVAPVPAAPARRPDELLYTVRVEADDGVREAHYTDSTLPEGVRSLIEWTDQRPERREQFQP